MKGWKPKLGVRESSIFLQGWAPEQRDAAEIFAVLLATGVLFSA